MRYFTKLLDKNLTRLLFRFANKYRPETRADNKRRRKVKKAARAAKAAKAAEAAAAAGNATNENVSAADKKKNKGKAKAVDPLAVAVAAYDKAANKTPYILKYGMNHVAELTEKQRAQLVVMSDDIEPPEVLIWLPALCRMYNVPYAIVKGSARLGTLVNKRSTTAVAFTEIREEEQLEFSQLADAINVCYAKINRQQPVRSSWMGGLLGFKARVKEALRATVTANRLRQQQQQRQQQ